MNDGPLYGESRATAAILCADPIRQSQMAELAKACLCDIVPEERRADFLLADISSVPGATTEDCSDIAAYLDRYGAEALVWVGVNQVDEAFAVLPAIGCHFLVDTDDALAVPILAKANRRAKMDQLHDPSRDGDYGDLHRMSDELAGFARTLARIAEQEGSTPPIVSDKPVSFRAAPSGMFEPMAVSSPAESSDEAAAVRSLIKLRRLREQHFPADLFADPGWDILLDLYAAKLEGKSVSVSSLCIAAAVPPTTGLRWITTMTEHGALVRRQDPNDARRVFIELSEDSENRINAYFREVSARPGSPI